MVWNIYCLPGDGLKTCKTGVIIKMTRNCGHKVLVFYYPAKQERANLQVETM